MYLQVAHATDTYALPSVFNLDLTGAWDLFWFQGVKAYQARKDVLDLEMCTEQMQILPALANATGWQVDGGDGEAIN